MVNADCWGKLSQISSVTSGRRHSNIIGGGTYAHDLVTIYNATD